MVSNKPASDRWANLPLLTQISIEGRTLKELRDYLRFMSQIGAQREDLRPAILFRPKPYTDGNAWRALYGDDIATGAWIGAILAMKRC
jgi:hypothetical protein